jgi:hypothetical protein
VQELAVGVTVIVPVIAAEPLLTETNDGVFPEPDAPRPIAVFEFVHANVAPAGLLEKVEAPIVVPAHTVDDVTGETVGDGFTVIVYVDGLPIQVLSVGVTVIVPDNAEAPEFAAVKEGTFPVPDPESPMPVSEFVQL